VWISSDGITWSRVWHDEDLFGGAIMSSVTAGGPGLVAVGQSDPNAAVWTSVDGITWSRVPYGETDFGVVIVDGETVVGETNVTVGGPGLVAVGVNFGEVPVWTSIDGITWTPIPTDWRVFDGGVITSVTVGGPGLVAVGGRRLYESADGITWTPTRLPDFADDVEIGSVAVGGPGLVAVGSVWLGDGDSDAAVWVRGD